MDRIFCDIVNQRLVMWCDDLVGGAGWIQMAGKERRCSALDFAWVILNNVEARRQRKLKNRVHYTLYFHKIKNINKSLKNYFNETLTGLSRSCVQYYLQISSLAVQKKIYNDVKNNLHKIANRTT